MSRYIALFCTPALAIASFCIAAEAQVSPNSSIKEATDRTIVRRDRASNAWQVRGGARRGKNLFHTFSNFRPNRSSVEFIVQPSINNVFALVSGRKPSRIGSSLNLIEQLSGEPHSANFYLINPRGITIAPGAALNVTGDLFLGTANSIGFGEQGRLPLAAKPTIPLLTANPVDFAFRRDAHAAVRVNGLFQFPPPASTSILAGSIDISDSVVFSNDKVVLGALRQGRYLTGQSNHHLVSQKVVGSNIKLSNAAVLSLGSIDVLSDGNLTLDRASTIGSLAEGDIRIDVAGTIELKPEEMFSNVISNNRGNIDIRTSRIKFGKNSSILVTAIEDLPEAAGDISIVATQDIELDGDNAGIFASTVVAIDEIPDDVDIPLAGTNNDAGDISITTPVLHLKNNASIRVSSGDDMGSPGDLRINAQRVVLDQGTLTAETGNMQGANTARGNIILNVSDEITLRNSSQITTLARGNSGGGNIFILNTPILRAVKGRDPLGTGNDIVADSIAGPGGNIIINTQRDPIGFNPPRFDVTSNQNNTPLEENGENDITATGANPGFIDIDTLTEVNQGNVEFPRVVIDPNSLIAQNPCSRGAESEFTLSGQGGLASNGTQSLNVTQSQVSPIPIPTGTESISDNVERVSSSNAESANPHHLDQLAQGWVYDQAGNVNLIAHKQDTTTNRLIDIRRNACTSHT